MSANGLGRGVPAKGYRMTKNRMALMASGVSLEDILGKRIAAPAQPTIPQNMDTNPQIVAKKQEFDINQRFEFVEQMITMVANGVQPAALITGRGGVGKSYTVAKTLRDNGYVDVSGMNQDCVPSDILTFRTIKGFSSAKGLYRLMHDNNNSVILLDDCDEVLENGNCLDLLKGALDSSGPRIISWNVEMRDSLPRSFEFTGRIILISNKAQEQVDQAVRSRALTVDVSMTADEMIERMTHIAAQAEFMPEYDDNIKMDALEFVSLNRNKITNLSLRSLMTVAKIRASNNDWQGLATYVTQTN
jgi:hypothetical protein